MRPTAGDSPQKAIPLATFQELVGQYHHRLLSLEADLKDRARAGGLSARAFHKRVRRLKQVNEALATLQRLCLAESPRHLAAHDVGLPLLEDCNPVEREICAQYLVRRERHLKEFEREAGDVYRWLTEAVTGQVGPIRSTLRLSKLRRTIQDLEKRHEALVEAGKSLAANIGKLLEPLKGAAPSASAPGSSAAAPTIDGLMTLFQQLDGTISRVARLKASVRREEAEIARMTKELREREAAIHAAHPGSMPPTPLSTALLDLGDDAASAKSRRRRELLDRFWSEILRGQAPEQPSVKSLSQAASLLKKKRP